MKNLLLGYLMMSFLFVMVSCDDDESTPTPAPVVDNRKDVLASFTKDTILSVGQTASFSVAGSGATTVAWTVAPDSLVSVADADKEAVSIKIDKPGTFTATAILAYDTTEYKAASSTVVYTVMADFPVPSVDEFKAETAQFDSLGSFENVEVTADIFNSVNFGHTPINDRDASGEFGSISIIYDGTEYLLNAVSFATTNDSIKNLTTNATDIGCAAGIACARIKSDVTVSDADLYTGLGENGWKLTMDTEYVIAFSLYINEAGQVTGTGAGPATLVLYAPNYAGWADLNTWDLTILPKKTWITLTYKFAATEDITGTNSYPAIRLRGEGDIIVDNYNVYEAK